MDACWATSLSLTVLDMRPTQFAIGGLAYWMPSFLPPSGSGASRSRKPPLTSARSGRNGNSSAHLWRLDGRLLIRQEFPAGVFWLSESAIATLILPAPFRVVFALTTTSTSLYTASCHRALVLFPIPGPISAAIINRVIATSARLAIALSVFGPFICWAMRWVAAVGSAALSDFFHAAGAIKIFACRGVGWGASCGLGGAGSGCIETRPHSRRVDASISAPPRARLISANCSENHARRHILDFQLSFRCHFGYSLSVPVH